MDKRSERNFSIAGKLTARMRERLRSFADLPHSLTVRLLASVLLFSACVTIVLTGIQIYLAYRHDVSALELQFDQISTSNLDSVAERLWARDENQLRLQLAGILRLPDMRAVEVRDARSAGEPLVISLGQKSASSAITREYPLIYSVRGQNTTIGTLYVEATLTDIYRSLFRTALTILINQAAETFLVALFIVYIFHNLVTRHLFTIANFAGGYRISDPPLPLRLKRPPLRQEDELQRVVTAFNALSDNLQVAYRNLHDTNEQLTRDAAARRQAEAILRERESRIRRLIDADIIGIFLWDIEGPILEANDAFLRLVGYDREDLVSGRLRWTDLTPPEWRDIDAQQWMPMLKTTGRVPPFEKEYFRKDGSRVPVLVGRASFEENSNQGVAFVLDLTERKQAEQARQELERLWRAAFESNPTMYFIVDPVGEIVSVNTFGAEQLGYSVSELVGQPVFSIFYEPDRKAIRERAKECFEQPGRMMRWEARKIRKDGSMLWVRETGNAVFLKNRPVLLVVCEDITEQKRAEEAARRSEKELRDVIETMPAMAFAVRPDGSTEFVNRRTLEYTGLSAETISEPGWVSTVHRDDLARHLAVWRAAMASGEPFENEVRHRNANGEYRWFLVRAVPLRDDHGNILKWYGILTDIQDRKQAEALLTGEKRILEMVAKGDSLAQILDGLCGLAEEQAGGSLASILLVDGDRLWHGAAPSLPKAFTDAVDGIVIGPSAGTCGTSAYRRAQVIVEDIATDPLWADFREAALPHSLRASWSTPVFSSQGKVIATFAMYYRERRSPSPRDQEIIEQITHLAGVAIERKLTQEALRRSEGHLSEAQKLSHTGSWAFNPCTGKTTYWSDEMYRLWGFDSQQGPPDSQAVLQRIHPEDRERVRELFERGFAGQLTVDVTIDHRIMLPDGTVTHHHGISHPVFDEAGKVVEYVGTALDVTELKRAEEALRRSEAYLAEAQRLTHTGSWAYDPIMEKAFYWSEETFRIFGLDPQRQTPPDRQEFFRLIHREDRDRFFEDIAKAYRAKSDFTGDYRIVLSDGTVKHVHEIGHPVLDETGEISEFVGTVVDATERKRAEEGRERLRQIEANLARINRVSMMGELTASLGHEIKQPIAAAVGNAEACLQWLSREQPNLAEVREAAADMVNEARRAAEIMTRLRSLFEKEEIAREVLEVNEIIAETVSLVREEAYRRSISVRTELDAELPRISADRVQLQQVLINLMLNGLEAMNDTGGELLIRSQREEGGQVLISVSDAGVGLPVGESEKIFDAFFTTKQQGTGMGLAISRSIVESHGGRLWATANSGHGTTFSFTLPNQIAESA